METGRSVVKLEKSEKKCPFKRPKGNFKPGLIERREEYRARIIDSDVSIRENIERNWKNYLYY